MLIAQAAIIATSVTGLAIYLYKKKDGWIEVLTAMLISLAWVGISGIYDYRDGNLIILSINIFSFTSWTGGLVLLKLAHDKLKGWSAVKLLLGYWIVLLVLEYIGYNWLGIQLDSNYTGLLGLPLMHAPLYSQIFYLSIGPIYLLLLAVIDKKLKRKIFNKQ